MRIIFNITLLAITTSLMVACNEDEKKGNPIPQQRASTVIEKDIPADINTKGRYTFYSFKTHDTISRADSATSNWDIALKSTSIIVNSGISGPGATQVQMLVNTFEEVTVAPLEGYSSDNSSSPAISTGSGNGWYNYNSTTHVISPVPGRVFVFRTSEGKYAKVEIVSYYKGAPQNPVNTDVARYYSFKLFYQEDGSRNLN